MEVGRVGSDTWKLVREWEKVQGDPLSQVSHPDCGQSQETHEEPSIRSRGQAVERSPQEPRSVQRTDFWLRGTGAGRGGNLGLAEANCYRRDG